MKVFVTGVGGQLGYDVVNELKKRGFTAVGSDILDECVADYEYIKLDITDAAAVEKTVSVIKPDVVIHCAAWTAVDAAEDEENKPKVKAINVDGTQNIANVCKKIGCKMVYISTDYVFNGQGTEPWQPDCKDYAPQNAKGVIHKNQAANRKSGIMALANSIVTDKERKEYKPEPKRAPEKKGGTKKAKAKEERKAAMKKESEEKAKRREATLKLEKAAAKRKPKEEPPAEEGAEGGESAPTPDAAPAEEAPKEEPKAEEKPAEEKPAEEKPAEEKKEEPKEEPKKEEKPEEKPAEEKKEDAPKEEEKKEDK